MIDVSPLDLLADRGARELSERATPEGRSPLDPALIEAVILGQDLSAWTPEEQAAAQQALQFIQMACDAANSRVNQVAAGRMLSPAEETLLTYYCIDIARYRLYDDLDLGDEHPVVRRYRDAISFLDKVLEGRIPLGMSASGQAQVFAPGRVFTAQSLADYR